MQTVQMLSCYRYFSPPSPSVRRVGEYTVLNISVSVDVTWGRNEDSKLMSAVVISLSTSVIWATSPHWTLSKFLIPPESWDNKVGEKDTVVSIICSSDNKHRWDLLSFFSSSASSLALCHFPSFVSCSHPISRLHKNHLCSSSIWLYLKLAGSIGNHTL